MNEYMVPFNFAHTHKIYNYIGAGLYELISDQKNKFNPTMVRNRFDVPISNQIKDDIGSRRKRISEISIEI